MSMISRKILSGLIISAAIIITGLRTLPPPAITINAPADQFSAGRALSTIKAITTSPRLVGSPAFEDAKTYLLDQMAGLGLKTDVQTTTQDGVKVENILGRLDGSQSTDAVLLSAHLDSVSNSPGATDDGSGVAEILETVRALRAETPLRNTVIVLFTGPEENCCFGAKAFVIQHPWAKAVRLVVNVDAGGLNGPSILAATGAYAGWLIEQAAPIIPDPIGSSAIEALGSPATDYTLLFRKAGWVGFDFNLSWSKRIHSPLDNVGNLNPDSIQHQGEHMLAVARRFGNLPLDFPRTPRPVYFDILGLTMVQYPTAWALFILSGITLLFAGTLLAGISRKCLTPRGIGLGGAVILLSVVTVPLLLAILQLAIIQPAMLGNPGLVSSLIGDSWLSNSIRWGSAILAGVMTFLWFNLFSRFKRIQKYDFAFAAYLILYICAAITTLGFPALSYLIEWPLLAGLTAMLFWFPSRQGISGQPGWLQLGGLLTAGVIAIVLFIPGILIALLSVDLRMIYLVPVFMVAFLGFLFPILGYFHQG